MSAQRELLKIAPRLVISAVVIITLVLLFSFIITFWNDTKYFLYFDAFTGSMNDMIRASLPSKLAGQLILDDKHAVVQIYGADDFSTPALDECLKECTTQACNDGCNAEFRPTYPELCLGGTCYNEQETPKSCKDTLKYLRQKEITTKNYANECDGKFCLCMVEFSEIEDSATVITSRDYSRSYSPPFYKKDRVPVGPVGWAQASCPEFESCISDCGGDLNCEQGCLKKKACDYNDLSLKMYEDKGKSTPYPTTDYVFDPSDGVAIYFFYYNQNKPPFYPDTATFVYTDLTNPGVPNYPQNYERIKDAAANTCLEFFGVNDVTYSIINELQPEDVFEKVVCRPIEGTDSEGRPLFLTGWEDIDNTDIILSFILTDDKLTMPSTRFFRENNLPEIGMIFTVSK